MEIYCKRIAENIPELQVRLCYKDGVICDMTFGVDALSIPPEETSIASYHSCVMALGDLFGATQSFSDPEAVPPCVMMGIYREMVERKEYDANYFDDVYSEQQVEQAMRELYAHCTYLRQVLEQNAYSTPGSTTNARECAMRVTEALQRVDVWIRRSIEQNVDESDCYAMQIMLDRVVEQNLLIGGTEGTFGGTPPRVGDVFEFPSGNSCAPHKNHLYSSTKAIAPTQKWDFGFESLDFGEDFHYFL